MINLQAFAFMVFVIINVLFLIVKWCMVFKSESFWEGLKWWFGIGLLHGLMVTGWWLIVNVPNTPDVEPVEPQVEQVEPVEPIEEPQVEEVEPVEPIEEPQEVDPWANWEQPNEVLLDGVMILIPDLCSQIRWQLVDPQAPAQLVAGEPFNLVQWQVVFEDGDTGFLQLHFGVPSNEGWHLVKGGE